jgi:hypothetical protein
MEEDIKTPKFIVLNEKFLKRLEVSEVYEFRAALQTLKAAVYANLEIDLSEKKYYICNQDEPYAQKVIDTILEGESKKI